jgi:predicted nucleic acid-binding protein
VIVVDTSAWVEFLRATRSAWDRALSERVGGEELAVPDVVRLELLAGANDEQSAHDVARLLARYRAVPATPGDHDLAAELYRRARRRGTTPRSLVDCLVAASCLRLRLPVMARDVDYGVLAAVSELELFAV